MNVLDENVQKPERVKLTSWRIRTRQIGGDIGRQGLKDVEIIPLLPTSPGRHSSPAIRISIGRNFATPGTAWSGLTSTGINPLITFADS